MKLGIIGGSGLYELEGVSDSHYQKIDTPYGAPSDELCFARHTSGVELVFLARHGRGHRLNPSELNHRANIFALKKAGVTHILSISAVGSLKDEMRPRDVVVIDQFFDRTKRGGNEHTFLSDGVAGHIGFAHPICPELAQIAADAVEGLIAASDAPERRVFRSGTYVNMEGPAFSTLAESNFYRRMGFDVIGMTNLAEAKLAREAQICYSTVAMVTDYDCWHPDHDHVTVEIVVANLLANTALAKATIGRVAEHVAALPRACSCPHALQSAIITNPAVMSPAARERLAVLQG